MRIYREESTGRRYMTKTVGDVTATATEAHPLQFVVRITRRGEDESPVSMQMCVGVSNARKLLRHMLDEAMG